MSALQDLWMRLRTEASGNLRLRLGIWAIAFIVLLSFILMQEDWKLAAQDNYAAAEDRLARAERLLGQGDWTVALDQERKRNERLEAQFWRAETPGLAEASLQAALAQMLGGPEFSNVRIRPGTSQPVPDAPGLWRVQAQVNARYRGGIELQLMHTMATSPRKLNVDRLDMVRRNSRLVMIVSAYFTGIAEGEE